MVGNQKRHLAAIMFTDLAGYTLLLGEDEEAARRVRERHRATVEAAVANHGGTLVNRMGDGTLTVFPTATEAVTAAVEIQQALQAYPRIPLRIGIHLGEVAYDDEGAFGDAVNVAARINAVATPGSVLVSESIRSHLENQPRLPAVELGQVNLKHVRRPTRIFAIVGDRLTVPSLGEVAARADARSADRGAGPLQGTPSIAVLPFVNMSANPDNEYFCDGLADDLITALSKLEGVRVAARTSAFSFKNREADVSEIGRKLGVTRVLEGGVRVADRRLRINVQLIDVESGFHLWSERYDRQIEDIFDIQDELTLTLVNELEVKLRGSEKAAVLKRHTENTAVYNLFLQGRFHWFRATPEDIEKSREYFQQAIRIDSGFAPAYVGLGEAYGFSAAAGLLSPDDGWPQAEAALTKALELDEEMPELHNGLAALRMFYERDGPGTEREVARALELNPKFVEVHNLYPFYLAATRRVDEAIAENRRALELDPLSARSRFCTGRWLAYARRYDEAIEEYRQALELDPFNLAVLDLFAAALEATGRYPEAVETLGRAASIAGDREIVGLLDDYRRVSDFAAVMRAVASRKLNRLEAKREAGGYVPASEYATAYVRLGDTEAALDWLDRAAKERNAFSLTIWGDPRFDALRENPRFQAVVERVKI